MKKFTFIDYENNLYNLEHLNSFYCMFFQNNENDKHKKKFKCIVEFSNHCFIKKQSNLLQKRIFYPIRYNLSKQLPNIIKHINRHKVFYKG